MIKKLLVCLVLLLVGAAHADSLRDSFDTVWEALWHQGGSPTTVIRWGDQMRVNVQGRNQSTHRARIVAALEKVTTLAGVRLVDVTDLPEADKKANLDVHIVNDLDLQDNQACFVRFLQISRSRIEKAELKMRDRAVYRCVLHEAMHTVGISGHPTGDTVLSYFYQRADALTELDRLMVRAWYSPEMRAGMTPFEAVVVLTDALVASQGAEQDKARAAQRAFLDDTLRRMEAFADEQGEVPVILKRSGTASGEAITRGRMLIRYFLGLAYVNGTVVKADRRTSLQWFERAARDGFSPAQMAAGRAYEHGDGVTASAADAYVWYSMAAAQEIAAAVQALKRVAAVMTPEEVEAAKARIPAAR